MTTSNHGSRFRGQWNTWSTLGCPSFSKNTSIRVRFPTPGSQVWRYPHYSLHTQLQGAPIHLKLNKSRFRWSFRTPCTPNSVVHSSTSPRMFTPPTMAPHLKSTVQVSIYTNYANINIFVKCEQFQCLVCLCSVCLSISDIVFLVTKAHFSV